MEEELVGEIASAVFQPTQMHPAFFKYAVVSLRRNFTQIVGFVAATEKICQWSSAVLSVPLKGEM
jgi:hypothetical protein